VHIFRPSLNFLTEAQPRLEKCEDKRHFLAEVHINFFMVCPTVKIIFRNVYYLRKKLTMNVKIINLFKVVTTFYIHLVFG
jgi:hypothetical protein